MRQRRDLPDTYHELMDLLPDEAAMSIRREPTRAVIAARNAFAEAERALAEAVWTAYESGNSWLTIGTVLGISRQAAQQRFGRRPQTGAGQGTGAAQGAEKDAGEGGEQDAAEGAADD